MSIQKTLLRMAWTKDISAEDVWLAARRAEVH
jgi:hypothetical protein